MPATSSAGRTAPWRCAGAPRGWSRPASSSAASTATCTCRPSGRLWRLRSPRLSPVRARIRRWWKRPDDHRGRHRSSTELRTSSGLVSLEDWLHATKAKVVEIDVTLSRVARIYIAIAAADELCAAVYQALRNVADHAETDRAWVFADVENGQLLTSVRDAGKGFEYDEHRLRAARKVGMLESMKGRIELLGGRMKVITAPGLGTTVEFYVPMQADWVSR